MRTLLTIALAGSLVPIAAGAIGEPAGGGETVREVQVVARRFTFEPPAIEVRPGERIRLVVRSEDGVHGLSVPALKIDLQVPRGGAAVAAEFTAPPPGRYEIACSEFCGSGHAHMKAAIVSVDSPPRSH
jgi:cytochrome c oxidase subunit 2